MNVLTQRGFAAIAAQLILTTGGLAANAHSASDSAPAAVASAENPKALTPTQSAAAVRERLRRCRLHPGTCSQEKSGKPDSHHDDDKDSVKGPDGSGVPRD